MPRFAPTASLAVCSLFCASAAHAAVLADFGTDEGQVKEGSGIAFYYNAGDSDWTGTEQTDDVKYQGTVPTGTFKGRYAEFAAALDLGGVDASSDRMEIEIVIDAANEATSLVVELIEQDFASSRGFGFDLAGLAPGRHVLTSTQTLSTASGSLNPATADVKVIGIQSGNSGDTVIDFAVAIDRISFVAVPEPASAAALGTGAAALLLTRRHSSHRP